MREQTAKAEKWRYIRSVLERRQEIQRDMHQRFLRQPLNAILRTRAQLLQRPLADPAVDQRSILRNRSPSLDQLSLATSPTDPNEQLPSRRWDQVLATVIRQRRVRFVSTDATPMDFSQQLSDTDVKLPVLVAASDAAFSLESQAPQVVHCRIAADHLPCLSMDRQPSSTGRSWAERQVAKVKQRKLWTTTESAPIMESLENATSRAAWLSRCPTAATPTDGAAAAIDDSASAAPPLDSAERGQSESDATSVVPDSGFVSTKPALNESRSDDGGTTATAAAAAGVAWEIRWREKSIEAGVATETDNAVVSPPAVLSGARNWLLFPSVIASRIEKRQQQLEKQTKRTIGEANRSLGVGNRGRRRPRWLKGKRPTPMPVKKLSTTLRHYSPPKELRPKPDLNLESPKATESVSEPASKFRVHSGREPPAATKAAAAVGEKRKGGAETGLKPDSVTQIRPEVTLEIMSEHESQSKQASEMMLKAGAELTDAGALQLGSERDARCQRPRSVGCTKASSEVRNRSVQLKERGCGGTELPSSSPSSESGSHATCRNNRWYDANSIESKARRVIGDASDDPSKVWRTSSPDNDCHCLHKAVLSCLLPDALNEALSNIETIRQQLKRTRFRQERLKQ